MSIFLANTLGTVFCFKWIAPNPQTSPFSASTSIFVVIFCLESENRFHAAEKPNQIPKGVHFNDV